MSRPASINARIGRHRARPLHRIRFEAGDAIYDTGEASEAFYRVVSGKVHLLSPRRRKGTDPDVLGPGAVFGQTGVLSGAARRDCATAASEVELDVLERKDALKLLDRSGNGIEELLAGLFDLAGQTEQTGPLMDDVEIDVDGVHQVRLVLKPASRPLAAWIGREPIEITRLPFVVGRISEGEDESARDHTDLILTDKKPYQLSRQHFVIDAHDGELVVRDSASYHGTTVNSRRIGGDRSISMAPLHLGENSIIAGSSDSPYCFTLLIEAS